MYTPQQIEFIKAFGNKELTEGCIVSPNGGDNEGSYFKFISYSRFGGECEIYNKNMGQLSYDEWCLEILGHPVEWHHVFAKLLEQKNIVQLFGKRIKVLREYDAIREINNYILDIEIDATISPMEQPILIEELLKLKQ